MGAITYSTIDKSAHLARIASSTDDKFSDPNEHGARVRQVEINVTTTVGLSATVSAVLAKIDKPSKLLGLRLTTDAGVATVDIGLTPVSLPVDGVNDIAAIATDLVAADGDLNPVGAINVSVAADEPQLLVFTPNGASTLALGSVIKGYLLYADNS
jgi:hypothetical protein